MPALQEWVAMAEELTSEEIAFRTELAEANINPDSFLATDYLNHFNEIVMLLEMAVDIPDLMEEAGNWKPATYVEHFRGSSFVARELVIEAWDMTSPSVRTRFEGVVSQLDQLILSILNVLKDAACPDGVYSDRTRGVVAEGQARMQEHLSMLNDIIHNGQADAMPGVVGGLDSGDDPDETASGSSEARSQDEIDQLFD